MYMMPTAGKLLVLEIGRGLFTIPVVVHCHAAGLLILVYVRFLLPWVHVFFALCHTHYWEPIHTYFRDMMTLHERHSDIASQFAQGEFVMHKAKRPFSELAIGHAEPSSLAGFTNLHSTSGKF